MASTSYHGHCLLGFKIFVVAIQIIVKVVSCNCNDSIVVVRKNSVRPFVLLTKREFFSWKNK